MKDIYYIENINIYNDALGADDEENAVYVIHDRHSDERSKIRQRFTDALDSIDDQIKSLIDLDSENPDIFDEYLDFDEDAMDIYKALLDIANMIDETRFK